jgi:xanthine/uracil permease
MFPKSWLRQLLETAVGLVAVGLLLNWAWRLLRPLVPVIVVVAVAVTLVPVAVRRFRDW